MGPIVAVTAGGLLITGAVTYTLQRVEVMEQLPSGAPAEEVVAALAPSGSAVAIYVTTALIVLASIAAVGWVVAGRLLSPLRQLRETAATVTLADLAARMPDGGSDDIAVLGRTINDMLDRLESSVDVQRQLLNDIRHELKTPITIVRGHLETMDATDPDDVRTVRAVAIAELDRMNRLVNDIDVLASVEGGDHLEHEACDLAALTDAVFRRVQAIPDHEWQRETRARGIVVGDRDRLMQAWLQLADNAAKFAPPGSPIEMGSAIVDGEARLWMRDHGPGVPHAARHRIFRRFDRLGGHREVSGSGLGLAIVDAIAKAHRGACSVSDTAGGGATFTICLPLRTAHPTAPAPVSAETVVQQREDIG